MKHERMLKALKRRINYLPMRSKERLVLEYLLENVVGYENKQAVRKIVESLRKRGVHISDEWFRSKILRKSRKGKYFIGSSPKGVFIINSKSDAKRTLDYYAFMLEGTRVNFGRLRCLLR